VRFRILDAADAAGHAVWLELWSAWPGREVMAHPEYVRLFARPCDRVLCPVGEDEGGVILFPLVLRPLAAEPWVRPGERRWDATSPYGYGGPFSTGPGPSDGAAFWRAYSVWAREAQVVSTFLRLSLFPEQLVPPPEGTEEHSPNIVVPLEGGIEEVWRRYRPNVRRWIRHAARAGLEVEEDRQGARMDEFIDLYEKTMRRRDAAEFYLFPRAMFEHLRERLAGQYAFFHVVRGGKVVCSDLTLASADRVYMFLVGTAEEALHLGANYLLKHHVAQWAIQEGKREYVLGGAHQPGDGLLRHKRSFAPRGEVPFRIANLVHDERAYHELCEARAAAAARESTSWGPRSRYFPEYRAWRKIETPRVHLSVPHMGGNELRYVREAFDSNWLSTVGPQLDAFERALSERIGRPAVALSSGTAAIHLGLRLLGVGPGDEVLVSDFTFVASVNPIRYLGATPVLVDSDPETWTMSPNQLEAALADRARRGKVPKAVIVVHLYGQCADMDPILAICRRHGVPVLEDAAEALGATYKGMPAGSMGEVAAFSFNGNKIITSTGGGMLVARRKDWVDRARFWSTQARDPGVAYHHTEMGFNYRLSNVLAAIGRGQLELLDERVRQRRAVAFRYRDAFADLPGLTLMPQATYGLHTNWLSCFLVDGARLGASRDDLLAALDEMGIEARPLWKPMHLQPLHADCDRYGGEVAAGLFERGLCLPSSSSLPPATQEHVIEVVRSVVGAPPLATERPAAAPTAAGERPLSGGE
jgi:pyridoxal phosphate-dependent aminotransferase EpsN